MQLRKLAVYTIFFSVALILGAGCAKNHGPDVPKSDEKALMRSRAQVNLLGSKLKKRVASDLQRVERMEDGRLQIDVLLRNRKKDRLKVEARTVFKDETGFSSGDETQWQVLYLEPRQSQTYTALSIHPDPAFATVEVRLPKK